jgi:hypothetical protein
VANNRKGCLKLITFSYLFIYLFKKNLAIIFLVISYGQSPAPELDYKKFKKRKKEALVVGYTAFSLLYYNWGLSTNHEGG